MKIIGEKHRKNHREMVNWWKKLSYSAIHSWFLLERIIIKWNVDMVKPFAIPCLREFALQLQLHLDVMIAITVTNSSDFSLLMSSVSVWIPKWTRRNHPNIKKWTEAVALVMLQGWRLWSMQFANKRWDLYLLARLHLQLPRWPLAAPITSDPTKTYKNHQKPISWSALDGF